MLDSCGQGELVGAVLKARFARLENRSFRSLRSNLQKTLAETAQLIIQSSKDFGIDLNAKDKRGGTAWHWACHHGQTETAKLIIQSSKDFGIDLNAKDNRGETAWREACLNGRTEIAQFNYSTFKRFRH